MSVASDHRGLPASDIEMRKRNRGPETFEWDAYSNHAKCAIAQEGPHLARLTLARARQKKRDPGSGVSL